MIGSWSQDTGLVSDEINRIEKGKKWIKIITNVVMYDRGGIAVCWTIFSSDSRELKRET